jgi:hypothetical protein
MMYRVLEKGFWQFIKSDSHTHRCWDDVHSEITTTEEQALPVPARPFPKNNLSNHSIDRAR